MAWIAARQMAKMAMPGLKNLSGFMGRAPGMPSMSGMMGRAMPSMPTMPGMMGRTMPSMPSMPNAPKTILGVQTYTFLMLFLILILIFTIIGLVVSTKNHIDDVCSPAKKK